MSEKQNIHILIQQMLYLFIFHENLNLYLSTRYRLYEPMSTLQEEQVSLDF
jgi:hypothetical protein